jgi:hypothetical protein
LSQFEAQKSLMIKKSTFVCLGPGKTLWPTLSVDHSYWAVTTQQIGIEGSGVMLWC